MILIAVHILAIMALIFLALLLIGVIFIGVMCVIYVYKSFRNDIKEMNRKLK